jgi:hypothetical protein
MPLMPVAKEFKCLNCGTILFFKVPLVLKTCPRCDTPSPSPLGHIFGEVNVQ